MTGPGPEKRASHEDLQTWMDWQPTRGHGVLDALALTPARIVVGVGAAMTVVATVLPWAAGRAPRTDGFEDVLFLGTQGAGDGVMLLLLAGFAGLLTIHRTPAASRVRIFRALPAVLVLLAIFSWINGWRAAGDEVDGWVRSGGSGGISIGVPLAGLGIALMVIGSIALLPPVILWKTEAGDPSDLMEITPGGVARAIGGIAGILVGGAVGIWFAVGLTPTPVIGLIAFGAVFGGLGGAYGGSWLAGRLMDEVRPPHA
jgi:hypothetical protein